jgi:hypothetical protein
MLNRRAQSITEYMLFFTIVAAAITGINTYMKRGIQGTVRSFSNMVGQQGDAELRTAVKQTVNYGTTTTDVTVSDYPSREIFRNGGEKNSFDLTQYTTATATTYNETGK